MNTLLDCVAPARADKNFNDSSPSQVRFTLKKKGQIDSYSRNLTTINFIRKAKKFCNMRLEKHNSRVSQQGRKICILQFNKSQEHVKRGFDSIPCLITMSKTEM